MLRTVLTGGTCRRAPYVSLGQRIACSSSHLLGAYDLLERKIVIVTIPSIASTIQSAFIFEHCQDSAYKPHTDHTLHIIVLARISRELKGPAFIRKNCRFDAGFRGMGVIARIMQYVRFSVFQDRLRAYDAAA